MGFGRSHSEEKPTVDGVEQGETSEHHLEAAKSAPAAVAVTKLSQKDELTEAQRRTLHHVLALTKVMDSAIKVPGTNIRFGLDGMVGVVPYAGDLVGGFVGTYIITRALKYHLPKRLVVRMLINQMIDCVVGVVPFIGDIFDIGFKANTRNMRLLQEHLEHPKKATRADTCFLLTLFFIVVVLPMILVAGAIVAIIIGILAATGNLH